MNTKLKKNVLEVLFWLMPVLGILFFVPLNSYAFDVDEANNSDWRRVTLFFIFYIMLATGMWLANYKYQALCCEIDDDQLFQVNREWQDFVKNYEAKNGALAEATQNLSVRIRRLYWIDGFDRVFPFQQAERLLDAHQRQAVRIEKLDEK